MIKFCQTIAFTCTNQCVKYELSAKPRTVTIEGKLFYDVILFWSVQGQTKKLDTFKKKSNVLKFPKMYNFCFGQKN